MDQQSAGEYRIYRDDLQVGSTSQLSWVDPSPKTGEALYRVIPVPTQDDSPVQSFGLWVDTSAEEGAHTVDPLVAVGNAGTHIEWTAFIRQARIDAPPAGCEYNSGYQYGGDNRGYQVNSSAYRIRVRGEWDFTRQQLYSYINIGTTRVYRKSTGALVASRTAPRTGNEVRDAGGSNGQTAYLAFKMEGRNPFCPNLAGSIAGQMIIKVTRAGDWTVMSGSHRQMPAHEIYINRNGTRTWTTVYQRQERDVVCLIGSACPRVNISGVGKS